MLLRSTTSPRAVTRSRLTRNSPNLSLDYPILSDPDKGVAKSYGVVTAKRELPHRWTYYVDAEGKILYIDRSVNTHSAGADVAARLKRLGVPVLSK